MAYDSQKTISGTEGEVWIDGDYISEVTALQAKVTLTKEEVKMCKVRGKKYKVTGYEGKGTLKMNKVNSRMLIKLGEAIKEGHTVVCTIISKLDDPDSEGTERIAIKDATFDELTLTDWEAKKMAVESIPFTFSDYEIYDTIQA
ncbi:phage tail tube protein [Clostridium hydrogenum]|uniref:phage tail tube protein n=1 Tax=Clostridium hydrogenum TaxID=2855764 RepID=UPI001F2E7482|nr:phage tail tube protein [Clostridium hydrogenum]